MVYIYITDRSLRILNDGWSVSNTEQKPTKKKIGKKWDGSKIIRVVCGVALILIRNKYEHTPATAHISFTDSMLR